MENWSRMTAFSKIANLIGMGRARGDATGDMGGNRAGKRRVTPSAQIGNLTVAGDHRKVRHGVLRRFRKGRPRKDGIGFRGPAICFGSFNVGGSW